VDDPDCTLKYCVVGAGSSGLAAAKNLKDLHIPFDVIEREDDVGGIWYFGRPHSSIYRSTHLISSKSLTQYTDFPMPKDYPDFPSHAHAWQYLRSYAQKFQLYEHIEFNRTVERIDDAARGWQVTLNNGGKRFYRGVIIANGHNWSPRYPDYPGTFNGTALHSARYKEADIFCGKTVLIVGAGNSGCDIAVEAAHHAASVYHSVRRGYYFIPKYLFGRPSDEVGEILLKLRLPLAIRRRLALATLKVTGIRRHRFGLPKPDHALYETHPIINGQFLHEIAHRRITPKPDVAELRGDRVRFKDGSEAAIDLIVYATGFKIEIPFIESGLLNWRGERPDFYLHVFHPEKDTLFIAGLIQPDSGQWGLVDLQTQLIARFIHAVDHQPAKAMRFCQLKNKPPAQLGGGIRYLNTARHSIEVEHFSYRERLQKLIRSLS
jgi:cation diffusion facilitator CzcD-associated flavoprotein CzcO